MVTRSSSTPDDAPRVPAPGFVSLAIMIATIGVASTVMVWFADDFLAFFASRTPVELGDVTASGVSDETLAHVTPGAIVRVAGTQDLKRSFRATLSTAFGKRHFRVYALITPGRSDAPILVQVEDRDPSLKAAPEFRAKKGVDLDAFSGTGRAALWDRLPTRYRVVKEYIAKEWPAPETARPRFIVMAGEHPSDAWWVVAVYVVLAASIAWNLLGLARWINRRRTPRAAPPS